MASRRPVLSVRREIQGVEVTSSGFSLDWTEKPDDRTFPADRTFAWCAEDVGLHFWCDHPSEVSRGIRGHFAGSRIGTLSDGKNYVHSANRWLADPLEGKWKLKAFGEELQEGLLALGIGFKGSPGTAALALFEAISGKLNVKPELEVNDWCEPAIYGGRVEAFKIGELSPVTQWDRASAYVAHLTEPLPATGSERWTTKPRLEREGITEAVVTVKPGTCPYPVLPARVIVGEWDTRVVYPWGSFWGRWTNPELRAARERGYEVKPVEGLEFARMDRSAELTKFAHTIWNARKGFPLAKRIGNAIVGKLHERRSHRVVEPFGPFTIECQSPRKGCRCKQECDCGLFAKCALATPGYCVACSWRVAKQAAFTLGPGSIFVPRAHVAVVLRENDTFPWYVNMAQAAYVLSRARLELLELLEKNERSVLAVATDGAIVWGGRPKGVLVGRALGEWRKEFGPASANVRGPTAYRLVTSDGKEKVRTAGISRTLAAQFLDGSIVKWKGRAGLLQRKVGQKVTRKAQASEYAGINVKRDADGWVIPPFSRVSRTPDGQYVNRLA